MKEARWEAAEKAQEGATKCKLDESDEATKKK
jgi:hypothetical protein